MDLISPVPVFNLYNSEWPIYTRQSISPPAKFVRGQKNTVGTALDSIVASGIVVSGGIVEGSVLSNDVYVGTSSRVLDSVLMDKVNIGEGAVVKRAIIDKNVKVPAGAAIGLDPELDRARGFKVTDSGITVLSKGQLVPEPGEAERALVRRQPASWCRTPSGPPPRTGPNCGSRWTRWPTSRPPPSASRRTGPRATQPTA